MNFAAQMAAGWGEKRSQRLEATMKSEAHLAVAQIVALAANNNFASKGRMRSALSTPSSDDSAADLAAYAGLLRDSSAGGTTLAAIFVQRVFRRRRKTLLLRADELSASAAQAPAPAAAVANQAAVRC